MQYNYAIDSDSQTDRHAVEYRVAALLEIMNKNLICSKWKLKYKGQKVLSIRDIQQNSGISQWTINCILYLFFLKF